MNVPLAAVPAFALVLVAVAVFVASLRQNEEDHSHTHLVVGIAFCALAVNAFVAGLALVGLVKNQDTITFWAAVTRTIAIICGSYVAYHWWRETKE